MSERSWRWTDAHFCSLPSQTNIYGCTKLLGSDGGTNKLLVASLVGKIFTIEYQKIFDKLTPITREIQFTYIPGDAEIVSVDALSGQGLVIGITFWKVEENESKQFLNFYSPSSITDQFDIESVAQNCQSLELPFVPYHLTHSKVIQNGLKEDVFLLSGSDNKIHLYKEVQYSFKEETCQDFFPEFANIPSCVHWMEVKYIMEETQRLSARGHQNGLVVVSVVDVKDAEVLKTFSMEHDSPITYLQLFSPHNNVPCPDFIQEALGPLEEKLEVKSPELNLLVLSALEPATVYRNIVDEELSKPLFLPESNRFDAVLCGSIIDIDFDGENEILIGTYGQELLAYKLRSASSVKRLDDNDIVNADEISKLRHKSDKDRSSPDPVTKGPPRKVKSQENLCGLLGKVDTSSAPGSPCKVEGTSDRFQCLKSYESRTCSENKDFYNGSDLLWQRSFACPIIGMNRVDIMADGMEDLVITTLKGLHILQPDLNEVTNVCLERLQILADRQEGTEGSRTATDKTLTDDESNPKGDSIEPEEWEEEAVQKEQDTAD